MLQINIQQNSPQYINIIDTLLQCNITTTLIQHNIISDLISINYIVDDYNVFVVDNFNAPVIE